LDVDGVSEWCQVHQRNAKKRGIVSTLVISRIFRNALTPNIAPDEFRSGTTAARRFGDEICNRPLDP
jgi:hypothetical protein